MPMGELHTAPALSRLCSISILSFFFVSFCVFYLCFSRETHSSQMVLNLILVSLNFECFPKKAVGRIVNCVLPVTPATIPANMSDPSHPDNQTIGKNESWLFLNNFRF